MTDTLRNKQMLANLWNPDRSIHGGGTRRPSMPVSGVVVSGDDPLEMGRIRVYCEALRDDPRNPESIPWAVYCSPFFGTINDVTARRGPTGDTTEGAVSYGMAGVPEIGSEVLLFQINGDPNARVWIGSIPNQQQINSWGTGRYVWSDDAYADGPYSGGSVGDTEPATEAQRIQPTYDNLNRAFNEDKLSPEWLSRGADSQPFSNPSASPFTGSRDQRYGEIQDILRRHRGPGSQLLKHYADNISSPGYGWSAIRSGLGKTSRVSRVYGLSTPGFHSFTMDDRHGNCRIRLRTTGGSQFLLDDTNERMYFSVGRGSAWQEMDWNGNIDMFAGRRFSVHASEDMNFTADGTIRLMGGKGIHIVAGSTDLAESEQNLPAVLPDGQVRIHSMDDMHFVSDKNIRGFSSLETFFTAQESMHLKTNDALYTWSKNDTNVFASKGSILGTAGTNIHITATKDISEFAGGNVTINAVMATHVGALTGKLDIAAGAGALFKVMGGAMDLQSTDGAINLQTADVNMALNKTGISASTTGHVLMEGTSVENRTSPTNTPTTDTNTVPASEDCTSGGPFSYTSETSTKTFDGQTYTWPSGPDNMARACYNAGFRGHDLVTMVAVMGQESAFGKNVRGPASTDSGKSTVNDPKWYPSCLGPFQIRCLHKPGDYSGLDAQRTPQVAFSLDQSAKWAYGLQKKAGFGQWSGYTDGKYKKYMSTAQTAVDKMCGTGGGSAGTAQAGQTGAAPGTAVSSPTAAPNVMPGSAASASPTFSPPPLPKANLDTDAMSSTVSAVKITSDSVRMQGMSDVFMKTISDDVTTSVQEVRYKMDDIVTTYNTSLTTTLGYINSATSQFKSMILNMATSLVTGLAIAGESQNPAAAIASMSQVVNDINNVVTLISQIGNGISAFSGFPTNTFSGLSISGLNEMLKIPSFDMNLSSFIPPQLTTLQTDMEQTYTELRSSASSLQSSTSSLGSLSDVLNVNTKSNPPSNPFTFI